MIPSRKSYLAVAMATILLGLCQSSFFRSTAICWRFTLRRFNLFYFSVFLHHTNGCRHSGNEFILLFCDRDITDSAMELVVKN